MSGRTEIRLGWPQPAWNDNHSGTPAREIARPAETHQP
jgi:hypothetical protein